MTAPVTAGAARAGDAGELTRMLASFVWVMGATVVALVVLGAIPAWVVGEGRAVHRVATVQDAERRLGARILVPGYFPSHLEWPPAEIRVAGGRRGSVRLTFPSRDGGPPVALLQAMREGEPISSELVGARTVLRTSPAAVGAQPATISDVLADGRPAKELAWEIEGRAMMLRSAGDVEELFRMAKSAHREGGR